jgi:LPS sulfotransferase NodH
MSSDRAAGANPEDLHSVTLVLSSTRSGSTLLCRDIASLGGLGSAREYLLGLEAESGGSTPTEADVLARVARGVQDEAPGVGAVKLMVPQAAAVAEALTGRSSTNDAAAMSDVVTWARDRFDRVFLVILVRNALEQAISRVVARETGIYHSKDGASPPDRRQPLDVDRTNQLILGALAPVLRHRAALKRVAAEHSDLALLLSYDELSNHVETVTQRLVAHAREQGFEPRTDTVTRKLAKVIGPEESEALRARFIEYFTTETGI